VKDIAQHHYSKIELTAFVVATNRGEMDREEIYFLTEAMVKSGRRLDWKKPIVVDKHCIGGYPWQSYFYVGSAYCGGLWHVVS